MSKSKIKVLFGLPSFSMGGIEKQLLQQFYLYDTNRYEIYLITLFQYKNRPNFYNQIPSHVKVARFSFGGYLDFRNLYALFKVLKSIRPDIVVSSMFSANSLFRVFKLFFKYKIITREHNTYTDRTIFHRIAEYLLSKLSDRTIAVSRDVSIFYCKQNFINPKKVLVINNGIDLDKINEYKKNNTSLVNLKKEFDIKENEKIIINVARLKKQKNHRLLIDTFKKFQEFTENYKLLILGGGQEYDDLLSHIHELHLEKKVILAGFREDVFDCYSVSDFFVLSSKIEGFPNVFLEAMSFGLPIISTNVPGANEIINNTNGFIVQNDDELLEKMTYLSSLKESDMIEMRKSCLITANNFDIRRIVNIYSGLFNELCNK